MERGLILLLAATLVSSSGFADEEAIARGKTIYASYCAPCHGVEGAGLVGPNLTDEEILYGSSLEEIINIITQGVPTKAMPSWASVLKPEQIHDSAVFVQSIMGNNLVGPARGDASTVTPFPFGTPEAPFLIRTFLPSLNIDPVVFAHHHEGQSTFKYRATEGTYNLEIKQDPIEGIPAAIAVSFGPTLSYCFDTTECRLLYTWSGPFLDMTYYWGEGSGGARKSFDYIARVIGDITFKASGLPPVPGPPRFHGYRKINGIPEMLYSIGKIQFTLRIEPELDGDIALLHYTTQGAPDGLTLDFSENETTRFDSDSGIFRDSALILSPAEAAAFTLRITR